MIELIGGTHAKALTNNSYGAGQPDPENGPDEHHLQQGCLVAYVRDKAGRQGAS